MPLIYFAFLKKYTWNFFTFSSKTTKRAIHHKMNRPPFSYYFPFRKYAQYLFSLSVISTYLAFPVLGTLGTITSSDFLLSTDSFMKTEASKKGMYLNPRLTDILISWLLSSKQPAIRICAAMKDLT